MNWPVTCESAFTFTFPRFITASILATRISNALITSRPCPTYMAPAFIWFFTKASCCIATVSTFGFMAETTLVSVVANTFHRFGTVTIFGASWELDTNITIWA